MSKPSCDALAAATSYRPMRKCSKYRNLRRCGRLLLCPHHRAMWEGKRDMLIAKDRAARAFRS